jgi:hypothetical protein
LLETWERTSLPRIVRKDTDRDEVADLSDALTGGFVLLPVGFLAVSVAVHVAGAFAIVAEQESRGSGVAVGVAWCCHSGGCGVVLTSGGVVEWY